MAFVGFHLSTGSKTTIETEASEIAHVSRCCLTEASSKASFKVLLQVESGPAYCIGILSQEHPQISLEHYITTGSIVTLVGPGNAKADLTGYIEPAYSVDDGSDDEAMAEGESSEDDEATAALPKEFSKADFIKALRLQVGDKSGKSSESSDGHQSSDDEGEEEASSDEEQPSAEAASSDDDSAGVDTTASVNAQAESPEVSAAASSESDAESNAEAGSMAEVESSSEEAAEVGEEDDSEEGEEDEEEDDEDDEDDSDDEEVESATSGEEDNVVPVPPKNDIKQARAAPTPAKEEPPKTSSDKKRKATPAAAEPPAKRKETEESTYKNALVTELKRLGGKTKIAMLGAKVQKPSGVPKLGQFLKKHTDAFVCEGPNVELHPDML
eukprot:Blabericola_migrator_1__8288@NODE_42_length_17171_cov_64_374065_g38_i0_p2_GENE_NODE_42_length_17171_cov_64_374065_g38_i0NODE_42_length_17171_cov_64_374065_g38_i0_p2_ORF_typecomplete_len384_score107_55NPL/PF17800_1/1_1e06RST/PF12174_8/0_23_NODE_42_length_17171_cov_64_374065_g38_i013712522